MLSQMPPALEYDNAVVEMTDSVERVKFERVNHKRGGLSLQLG
jgi:hypothetical protein